MKMLKVLTVAILLPALLCAYITTTQAYPDKAGVEHPLSLQEKPSDPSRQTDDYPQMPGWPNYMGVLGLFAPQEGSIQVDIDDDGDLEIFAGSTDNYLYGWEHDGSNIVGFPIYTSGPIQSSPAAGDIDGDGDLEILIANRSGDVYAFHLDGTSVTGWPQHTFDEIAINSVALWDFDEDGDLEVFVGSDRLYVWDGDGTLMPGFPVNFYGDQYGTCSSSSVGDIDGDGDPEIILEGWDYLNAFHHDGTMVLDWPYALTGYFGFSYAAPSLVDIDGDGDVEIFCAAHESGGGGWNSELYGLDGDGSDLPGFPQFIQGWTYSTPSIGDLDGDGEIEIALLCNSGILYAFNPNGTSPLGWPVYFGHYNCEAATAMVDIDNNGQLDLLFGNNGGTQGFKYLCYRGDGSPHPDFPFTTDGATFPNCSSIADADGDGDLEIAHYVGSGTVNLWDAPYPAAGAARPWPMAHHDVQHTGNYHYGAEVHDVSVTLTPYGAPIVIPAWGGSFDFNVAVTNNEADPVTFSTWIMVTMPSGAQTGPVLGPVSLTLSGGASLDRDRTQNVPERAPAGFYTYTAYAGQYPNNIWNEDSFQFEKQLWTEGGGASIGDWSNTGEDFGTKGEISVYPSSTFLFPSHPNPFNPTTTLNFELRDAGFVNLAVYDISGRLVATLINGWRQAGSQEITFDGSELASGIYFYRLEAGDFTAVRKMTLMK